MDECRPGSRARDSARSVLSGRSSSGRGRGRCPAAIVPVAVGTAVAWWWRGAHGVEWWKGLAALVVALAVQVGTNYANDYSDGVRGHRQGPGRAGPAGRLGSCTPAAVATASMVAFGVAGVAGLVLAATRPGGSWRWERHASRPVGSTPAAQALRVHGAR